MKRSYQQGIRNGWRRRGVTLVEMLVTLAVLLLMMTAVVRIFQAATGALNAAQVYQDLDNQLRRLDATIRSDLRGVTARMTPPLNPKDNLGYFEYGENSFSDLQGEDCDDYVRFTAKAPAGHPFVGRVWPKSVINSVGNIVMNNNTAVLPITITSDYAEIIYFLRNGNLYRRVLLVAPDRQSSITQAVNNIFFNVIVGGRPTGFYPVALGGNPTAATGNQVSWQGVNDLSAHPAPTGPNSNITGTVAAPIVLNSLGDLTNRENRFAYPRFANDFITNGTGAPPSDGVPDDSNLDGIPDFYPTLYYNCPLIFAPGYTAMPTGGTFQTVAFPFVYPGAYSQPETDPANVNLGWTHSPIPDQTTVPFATNPLLYLERLNHNPLDIGDNLHRPDTSDQLQTWWGFPTWRETLSFGWVDPTFQVNINGTQPTGLNPRDPTNQIGSTLHVADESDLLPPMTSVSPTFYRTTPQPYTDSNGSSSAFYNSSLWSSAWEDDLIMTVVRSFDIKAYDDLYGGFVDLGWGNDVRLTGLAPSFLTGNPIPSPGSPPTWRWSGRTVPIFSTFVHEGRMPPLTADHVFDAQFGQQSYPNPYSAYTGNLGDDRNTVVRLRRVWDSWSTEYTNAPAYAISNPLSGGNNDPWGPPFTPPIYPSYPPPYPAPLKGIQIQVRVTDPANQRIKQITIRHDFTDRL